MLLYDSLMFKGGGDGCLLVALLDFVLFINNYNNNNNKWINIHIFINNGSNILYVGALKKFLSVTLHVEHVWTNFSIATLFCYLRDIYQGHTLSFHHLWPPCGLGHGIHILTHTHMHRLTQRVLCLAVLHCIALSSLKTFSVCVWVTHSWLCNQVKVL